MTYKVMAIYDSKAEFFERPFYARSTGEGLRAFSDDVNSAQKESPVSHHPEDFVLYELGTWDASKGLLDAYDVPKAINRGIDVKRAVTAA